ncbi:MAG: hypothetical protein DRP00_04235, partial [Candidatus Aenigmatarchaeota archaeon]
MNLIFESIKTDLEADEIDVLDSLLELMIEEDITPGELADEIEYDEVPVSIDTFISDEYYLGKPLDGGRAVWPYWKKAHREIQEKNPTEVALTGSIRRGKSFNVAISLAYDTYKLLCMTSPQISLGLAPTTQIGIAFFNITQSLADDGIYRDYNDLILKSPWFMERCQEVGTVYKRVLLPKNIVPLIASPFKRGYGVLGKAVIFGAMDEISDVAGDDENKARQIRSKAQKLYVLFANRVFTQFVSYGRLYLISSKKDEQAFLESYIEKRKASKEVLVFDGAIYDTVPPEKYSGITFPVAVGGDSRHPPEVIGRDKVEEYEEQGYTIVYPPIEYRDRYELDIIDALRDISGISITAGRAGKLIHSESQFDACLKDLESPIDAESCILAEEGGLELDDHIDISKIMDPMLPHYIHVDIGLTSDALGFGLAHAGEGKKLPRVEFDGTKSIVIAPTAILDFVLQVRNAVGQEVSLPRVTEAIQRLYTKVNIVKVSADGYQSKQLLQSVRRMGIATEELSLDRDDSVYLAYKRGISEARIVIPKKNSGILREESLALEHDKVKKKVDHPLTCGKDCSDAGAGAVYHILKESVAKGKVNV